jgi:hypothetical protein
MIRVVVWLMLFFSITVNATPIPPLALVYLPQLKKETLTYWPEATPRSILAAQVEQESCVSLKSKRCWNPRVELKTDREYGFGLGQLTITSKFNAFEEVRTMDASMRDWRWEDRYNAAYQLRAIVLKNRANYRRVTRMTSDVETQMAFTMAAYNGGLGGLMKDRVVCQNTAGCNPARWFGHVERTSTKSKTAVKGYGKSFFEINREYVRNALGLQPRRAKYVPYMDSV